LPAVKVDGYDGGKRAEAREREDVDNALDNPTWRTKVENGEGKKTMVVCLLPPFGGGWRGEKAPEEIFILKEKRREKDKNKIGSPGKGKGEKRVWPKWIVPFSGEEKDFPCFK